MQPNNSQENALSQEIKRLTLNLRDEVNIPPACLLFVKNEISTPICTLGNISMIIGKAKSRKSTFLSIVVASLLSNNNNFPIVGKLSEEKNEILFIDTEQDKHHAIKNLKRIKDLSSEGLLDKMTLICLRPKSFKERIELIDHALKHNNKVGYLIIDGIRDLVADFNSIEESSTIVSQLMTWSQEHNIHITTVLHENKTDGNARGHLGAELTNKSETVLSVKKEGDRSIIESVSMRGKEIDPFAFECDQNGTPYSLEEFRIAKSLKTSKNKSPENVGEIIHLEVLTKIFTNKSELGYTELLEQIGFEFSTKNSIGIGYQKEYLKFYKNNNWITQKTNKKYILSDLVRDGPN